MITAEKPGHKPKSNFHVDVRNSAAPAVATPDYSPDHADSDAAQEDIKPEIQVDLPGSVYI